MAEQKNPQAQPELSLSEQTRIRREKLATLGCYLSADQGSL